MRKFLTMMIVFVFLFAAAANAAVLTLEKDAGISAVAKFVGVYPADIWAMNPQLDGKAIVKAKQKILYVSLADKSDAMDFCKRELRRINRGEKDTYPVAEMKSAVAVLQVRPLVISYATGKEGIAYGKVLEYAKAYHKRHAERMK